jgi:prolyl oligopeptidase
MQRHFWLTAFTLSLLTAGCSNQPTEETQSAAADPLPSRSAITYPQAKRGDVVDDYHGVKVADPYRWLEDLDSTETANWIAQQNQLTQLYLADSPVRDELKNRLEKLWNFERFTLPQVENGRYVVSRNSGLQNQSVVYQTTRLDGDLKLLLDPNTLAADGTVALSDMSLSHDGKKLAYSTSASGSDWQTWRVRDVDSATDTADVVEWSKFSNAAWRKDGRGFYYSRYASHDSANALKTANVNHQIYFHRLGTAQAADELIFERADQPNWTMQAQVSEDDRFLIVSVSQGTSNKAGIFWRDLASKKTTFQQLVAPEVAAFEFIANQGDTFYLLADQAAPRYNLIAWNIRTGKKSTVIAQDVATLRSVSLVGGQFIANYLRDALSDVRRFSMDGKLIAKVALPGPGSAAGFAGGKADTETFYSYTDAITPEKIYRLDMRTGESSIYKQPSVDFSSSEFVAEQVFYSSKDGSKIPMMIARKKSTILDGTNPTILYGYGGFNISQTPKFYVPRAVWLERGGIFAVANLRGGGEYGAAWHEAGMKLNKQNVFDDFAAAAEYLIAQKYTSPAKLAIQGGSNGGLLVAVTQLQRPELFAAALPAVGVLDMLRFNQFTIGKAWESDYGSPQNKEEFAAIFAYSPLHNVRPGSAYPATLVLTGDHDDRVFPAHSFKFTAAMQYANPTGKPYLIRVETKAGHGAGKPTSKIIDEAADMFAFALKAMDVR